MQAGYKTLQNPGRLDDFNSVQPRVTEDSVAGRLLIVEDNRTQAAYLRGILERAGYEVESASNGREAIDVLSASRPDAVITDIVMPEMDGFELCRLIKSSKHLEGLSVILVTALSDPEDVLGGLECGADNLITKPYESEYLLSRIAYSLENRDVREDDSRGVVEVTYAGKKHRIKAGRIQILNLLLSTYQTAVQKNADLERTNSELREAQKVLASQAEELHELSLRDELTGLYNRRGFLTLAEQQLKMAVRTRTPLLLFYLDLDGLKTINDTLGHTEGDVAIVAMSGILTAAFRDADIVARVGGDEFVVLEIGARLSDSNQFSQRLRSLLDCYNEEKKAAHPLSSSVGLADFDPEEPCSIEELMARADAAMYEQKKSRGLARS